MTEAEDTLLHTLGLNRRGVCREVPPIDPPGCWMALLVAMSVGFGALCVGWLTGGVQ